MIQIAVNNKTFSATRDKQSLSINDKIVDADIAHINDNTYHVINDNQSYTVEVVEFDAFKKAAVIKVNGNTYSITAKDQFDMLLEQMGLSDLKSGVVDDLKAPMPGMVLKILVAENDTVQKGDNLFVLEAMKMENIIKSPGGATVKSIKIKPGDKVEKGQVLITFA